MTVTVTDRAAEGARHGAHDADAREAAHGEAQDQLLRYWAARHDAKTHRQLVRPAIYQRGSSTARARLAAAAAARISVFGLTCRPAARACANGANCRTVGVRLRTVWGARLGRRARYQIWRPARGRKGARTLLRPRPRPLSLSKLPIWPGFTCQQPQPGLRSQIVAERGAGGGARQPRGR